MLRVAVVLTVCAVVMLRDYGGSGCGDGDDFGVK